MPAKTWVFHTFLALYFAGAGDTTLRDSFEEGHHHSTFVNFLGSIHMVNTAVTNIFLEDAVQRRIGSRV